MTDDDFVPSPRPDHIEAASRLPFPGDDNAPAATCEQIERCATIVAAYARGHEGYRDALPEVARFLMLAGVTARASLGAEEPDLVAAWEAVDVWPWPRQGAPRAQPS